MTPQTAAELVATTVERAALDGSTCVPMKVVAAVLRGAGVAAPAQVVQAVAEAGRVVSYPDEHLLGHPRWAPLEEQVGQRLVDLVTSSATGAVTVVDTPRGTVLPPTAEGTVVVEDAHRLGLAEAAELLDRVAVAGRRQRLVLAGDPAMPYAPGPGRVLADVVASGAVPVESAPAAPRTEDSASTEQLVSLVAALRAGVLPAVEASRREVVVTTAADPDQAVHRAVQLVTSSVPRTFGVAAADTLVAAPRAGGTAGTEALRVALDTAGAGDVRTATTAGVIDTAEAIVLVLSAESAGSITRSMLVGVATQATRHLSVVHQAGLALADAVARRTHPPRRTRLAAQLASLP